MKRILALLLTLAMLLSLCSCGVTVYEGEKIYVQVKNDGSKHLTLIFSAPGLSAYDREASVSKDDEGNPYIQADLAKVADQDITYKLTANEANMECFFNVSFTSGEESFAYVVTSISVDKRKNVSLSGITIMDAEPKAELEGIEGASVTTVEGSSSKTLSLSGENGAWKRGGYDSSVVEVSLADVTDDNYYNFTIDSVAPGSCTVQLINREAMMQALFQFTVHEVVLQEAQTIGEASVDIGEADESVYVGEPITESAKTGLVLTLDSYEFRELTKEEDPEWIARQNVLHEEIPEEFAEAFIPEEIELDDVYSEVENEKTLDLSVFFKDVRVEYYISDVLSLEEETAAIEEAGVEKTEQMTIGGFEVTYFVMKDGFSIAIWNDGAFNSRLTFIDDEQSDETNRALLNEFLTAKAI